MSQTDNTNPSVFAHSFVRPHSETDMDNAVLDPVDALEIYDMVKDIKDPEHPLSLGQLNVVNLEDISVENIRLHLCENSFLSCQDKKDTELPLGAIPTPSSLASLGLKFPFETVPLRPLVSLKYTPTVPHCSMATLIGLCITKRLRDSLPKYAHLTVTVKENTHSDAENISKQLNDKERVAAALENQTLMSVVNECLLGTI